MQGGNPSEDFFNNQISGGNASAQQRKPPPPPPRPAGTGTTTGTAPRRTSASRVPPAGAAAAAVRRQPPPRPTSSASSSSYYGSGTTTGGYNSGVSAAAPVPATKTSRSAAPAAASSSASYYGTGSPASFAAPAASSASTSHSQFVGTSGAAAASSSDGWYTGPSSAPQMQQHEQQQPAYMMPSSSSYGGQHQPQTMAPTSGQQLSGSMDSGGLSGMMSTSATPSTFVPRAPSSSGGGPTMQEEDYENEPPLMEELGIHMDHIFIKTRAVVLPFRQLERFTGLNNNGEDIHQIMQEPDMAGPLVFALLLGGEMLLMGKFQFSYIYFYGLFGCASMTLILTLMKQPDQQQQKQDGISFWTVTSILGYALLPVNLLAFLKIFLSLGRMETLNRILGLLTIAWCTVASTRLMEQGCDMRPQRYLIAYPIALLYSAFVLITVF